MSARHKCRPWRLSGAPNRFPLISVRPPTWATEAVAFAPMVRFVQPALVNGSVGLVWAPRGHLRRALSFAITGARIARVDIIAECVRLRDLDLAVLNP